MLRRPDAVGLRRFGAPRANRQRRTLYQIVRERGEDQSDGQATDESQEWNIRQVGTEVVSVF